MSELSPYDLLIFDSDDHPPLESLLERGKQLYGYFSLAEISHSNTYYQRVRDAGLLLDVADQHTDWSAVDVRDQRWSSLAIEELVPSILAKGFTGLFLDSADVSLRLEEQAPEKFVGTKLATADLIKAIRLHYPHITLILNQGYDLLPEVGGVIDHALGESILSAYNAENKEYYLVNKALSQQHIDFLQSMKNVFKELRVMTLDYWDPNDRPGLEKIYAMNRENGFIPYVATIELDQPIPETKL